LAEMVRPSPHSAAHFQHWQSTAQHHALHLRHRPVGCVRECLCIPVGVTSPRLHIRQ
jgi:hypothetical protein